MATNKNRRIKITGYARRIFFNDNIEYRNFSPDLVGLQLTSKGGTPLFTMGNFSIEVNLEPKTGVFFKQGGQSKVYTLDDIVSNSIELVIQKNLNAGLNLDLTNPLNYIWYGSTSELIRASLENILENWPAAIYVDNKVGSVTGNNITNYVYDIVTDEATFTINSRYFVNPFKIKYTSDEAITGTEEEDNPLRNFTLKYKSYTIEHNSITKNIKNITPTSQVTNSDLDIIVEGNPFPELTGVFIPQNSFMIIPFVGSIPFLIKPNELERENFFTTLNDLQQNILNRNSIPKYKSIITSPKITDNGVVVITTDILIFPILDDGYNLNFFDSFYITYLDKLNTVGENYDQNSTDLILRKYTAEVISSFDTVPRGDGDDLTLNGEKATKLLRIYGVEFDEVKKYINGIKFAHVVTYDKKDNIPDSLVKDLAHMLGFQTGNFVSNIDLNKTILPSYGGGQFSGTSTNLPQQQIDIELYRRLILNIAWMWKSKGTRKAIEFLFRFIGAPEALVKFNEYIVIVDKPLDLEKIKQLLYIYTGTVDTSHIPYDENGFPLPPQNGELVVTNIDSLFTGSTTETQYTEMYFQKAGGWYRETLGSDGLPTILEGNNPHMGPYDGGNEYLNYFSKCFIPNFSGGSAFSTSRKDFAHNIFLNYNYGIFNSIPIDSPIYTSEISYNSTKEIYEIIDDCIDVNYDIIETPLQNEGKTTLQEEYDKAKIIYDQYVELIKKYSFMQYSPEWQKIKYKYELAKSNYNNEIVTENCSISGNQTLEICITPTPQEEIGPTLSTCDEYEVYVDGNYLYFYHPDNWINLNDPPISENASLGLLFAECCRSVQTLPNHPKIPSPTYFSYVETGLGDAVTIELCAYKSPCPGEIDDIDISGLVTFSIDNNTYPPDVYPIDTDNDGICDIAYQSLAEDIWNGITKPDPPGGPCNNCESCSQRIQVLTQSIGIDYNYNDYGDINDFLIRYLVTTPPTGTDKDKFILILNNCFKQISCENTTTEASLECCAYHELTPVIINPNAFNEYVTCIKSPILGGKSSFKTVDSPINKIKKLIDENTGKIKKLKKELVGVTSREKNQLQIEIQSLNVTNSYNYEEIRKINNNKSVLPSLSLWKNIPDVSLAPGLNNAFNFIPKQTSTNIINAAIISPSKDLITNPLSVGSIPKELIIDKNLWVVVPDSMGVVSFAAEFNKKIYTLTPYTTFVDGANIYQQLARSIDGINYGLYKVNLSQKTVSPVKNIEEVQRGKSSFENGPVVSIKYLAVVSHMINCEDINNVSIVFGSELAAGFMLPQNPECECTIDFSFDYMLKYNASALMECAECEHECLCWLSTDKNTIITSLPCFPSIFHNVSTHGYRCFDFIVFTETEEQADLLQDNFSNAHPPHSGPHIHNHTEADLHQEVHVWQDDVVQLNPSPDPNLSSTQFNGDCCIAFGGQKTKTENWIGEWSLHWAHAITTYQDIAADPIGYIGDIDIDFLTYISQIEPMSTLVQPPVPKPTEILVGSLFDRLYEIYWGGFECDIVWSGIDPDSYARMISHGTGCEISDFLYGVPPAPWYSGRVYISTPTICALYPPDQCKLWAILLDRYRVMLDLIDKLRIDLQYCVSGISGISEQIINEQEIITGIDKELEILSAPLPEDREILLPQLTLIGDQITNINDEQGIISEGLTATNIAGNIDCEVYITIIKQLKNPKEIEQIKTLQNECINLQRLNEQLIIAVNEGVNSKITELETEIYDAQSRMNQLLIQTNSIAETLPTGTFPNPVSDSSRENDLITNLAKLIGVPNKEITNPLGGIQLTPAEKEFLNTKLYQNGQTLSKLLVKQGELSTIINRNKVVLYKQKQQNKVDISKLQVDKKIWIKRLEEDQSQLQDSDCCGDLLVELEILQSDLATAFIEVEIKTNKCYDDWYDTMYENYLSDAQDDCGSYIDYIDDLKLNFKLFVDTGVTPQNSGDSPLIAVPYTEIVNPMWTWNPDAPCSGIFFEGDESDIIQVETGIIDSLSQENTDDGLTITSHPGDSYFSFVWSGKCYTTKSTNSNCGIDTFFQSRDKEWGTSTPSEDTPGHNGESGSIGATPIGQQSGGFDVYSQEDHFEFDLPVNVKVGLLDSTTSRFCKLTVDGFSIDTAAKKRDDSDEEYDTSLLIDPYNDEIAFIQWLIENIDSEQFKRCFVEVPCQDGLFTPCWNTFKFHLPECVCEDLRREYPNKRFFIGIEIENYECSVCLLVDNIKVNITDCDTEDILILDECYVPQLSCVIDNKKSWVYTEKGIEEEMVYPFGSCNSASTENYSITKMVTPETRVWQELEYRYTEYEVPHSDLIINTKSATFAIDPANAIECDVYNFWRKINCDECPTSCDPGCYLLTEDELYIATESGCTLLIWCNTFEGDLVEYRGVVRATTSSPLSAYTITLTGCSDVSFSCETYTTILENKVKELKNEYYTLTADYYKSLNASYSDLKKIGGDLTDFGITRNNCGSDTIVIGNYKDVNQLFGLLLEEMDSTLSFYEVYISDTISPYSGGSPIEIYSGYTAQTFDYSSDITAECCKSFNSILNSTGEFGMGLDKNYVWSEEYSACTWTEINNCQGDCEYSGFKDVNYFVEKCVTIVTGATSTTITGTTTGYTASGYCTGSYSATPAGDACQYIVTSAATFSGIEYTAYTGSKRNDYSRAGSRWYDVDMNTAKLPLVLDNTGSIILYDDLGAVVPVKASVTDDTNLLWDSGLPTSPPQASTGGRLNACGVWGNYIPPPYSALNPPHDVWFGFSYCVNLENSGIYTVGIGADNKSRFFINSVEIFNSEAIPTGGSPSQADLKVWKMFEMNLTSGEYIIQMQAGSFFGYSSFGAEIYSATTAQLSGMTTEAELSAVTVFSTASFRTDIVFGDTGAHVFDFGISGDTSFGYSCPAGWAYGVAPCYLSATCVSILTSGLTHDITATTTSTTVCITGTTTACTEVCEIEKVPTCVNPLDYLDIVPSEITIKEVFDEAILRSLIDVKSRQTISGYPMLQLFYQLYLNASNCGKDLTGKLDYNNLFEFMDKIGDYWLDLIEQVVPATTIWNGCDNSGKIYRNTIFDQDKYAYKRYALNYICLDECNPISFLCNGASDIRIADILSTSLNPRSRKDDSCCHLSAYTSNSIGSQTLDVRVEIIPRYPSNEKTENIKKQIKELEDKIRETEETIVILETKICALESHDTIESLGSSIEELILGIKNQIEGLMVSLLASKEELINLNAELLAEQEELAEQQLTFQTNNQCCTEISSRLKQAQENLINNFIEGTVSYERQEKFVNGLKNEYKKCIDRYNTRITKCNTVFITQIYDTNEYEGNVSVSGDREWNSDDPIGGQDAFGKIATNIDKTFTGKAYNTNLIHDCDKRSRDQIISGLSAITLKK